MRIWFVCEVNGSWCINLVHISLMIHCLCRLDFPCWAINCPTKCIPHTTNHFSHNFVYIVIRMGTRGLCASCRSCIIINNRQCTQNSYADIDYSWRIYDIWIWKKNAHNHSYILWATLWCMRREKKMHNTLKMHGLGHCHLCLAATAHIFSNHVWWLGSL